MKYFLTLFAAVLFAVSCTDLSSLENEIGSLADKIAALEGRCDKMNSDIDALSRLIDALKKEDMVTSVMPITLPDGTVEGYVVNFLHSGMITIYNGTPGKDGQDGAPGKDGQDGKPGEDGKDGEPGKDGEDGKDGQDGTPGQDGQDGQDGAAGKDGEPGRAPVISVKKASDGKYYWTADGEWVLDEDGTKVEVDMGNEPPMLKVEQTSWYISYDGGDTWSYLADYTYDEVGYVFSDVDISDSGYVRFTLSDGSVIELPMYKDVSVSLECDLEQSAAQGSVVRLSYSVAFASEADVLVDDSDIESSSIAEHGPLSGEITLCLKQSVKVTSQRAFVIFKIDDRDDDWWMVTFDGAGKVIVTDIR